MTGLSVPPPPEGVKVALAPVASAALGVTVIVWVTLPGSLPVEVPLTSVVAPSMVTEYSSKGVSVVHEAWTVPSELVVQVTVTAGIVMRVPQQGEGGKERSERPRSRRGAGAASADVNGVP